MKQGILKITICPENDMFERLEVEQSYIDGIYDVNIHTLLEEPLSSIVTDPDVIKNVKDSMEFNLQFEDFEFSFPFYRYVLEHCEEKDFFTNTSIVYINGIYEDIAEYLKRNPELLTKEIVLAENLSLDKNTALRLKEVFKDFPNIKLMVDGNQELVSITQYSQTVDAIDSIVEKINRYNYSPLEQLILAYDLIRDRFYVKEDETEEYSVSRDLTSSLLGDKIVCVGFANIFDAVCKKLGFNSMIFLLNNKHDTTSGHARNMIYMIDEKYGIEGIYFFDPTFDCKKDDINSFLYSYRFFAKDYIEMNELSGNTYMPRDFKLFDFGSFHALLDRYEALNGDLAETFRILTEYRMSTLLKFINRETIDPFAPGYEPSQIEDAAYDLKILAENSIGAENFLKALYTVRKNQYYENPEKYMFDVQTLTKIISNSRFRVDDNAEFTLLSAMGFNYYYSKAAGEEKVRGFIEKNNLEIDIGRTKLARTLREVLEARLEEENKGKKL